MPCSVGAGRYRCTSATQPSGASATYVKRGFREKQNMSTKRTTKAGVGLVEDGRSTRTGTSRCDPLRDEASTALHLLDRYRLVIEDDLGCLQQSKKETDLLVELLIKRCVGCGFRINPRAVLFARARISKVRGKRQLESASQRRTALPAASDARTGTLAQKIQPCAAAFSPKFSAPNRTRRRALPNGQSRLSPDPDSTAIMRLGTEWELAVLRR